MSLLVAGNETTRNLVSGGLLALDVGTQSVRAALVDLRGDVVALVKTPIEPYFSARPG